MLPGLPGSKGDLKPRSCKAEGERSLRSIRALVIKVDGCPDDGPGRRPGGGIPVGYR